MNEMFHLKRTGWLYKCFYSNSCNVCTIFGGPIVGLCEVSLDLFPVKQCILIVRVTFK